MDNDDIIIGIDGNDGCDIKNPIIINWDKTINTNSINVKVGSFIKFIVNKDQFTKKEYPDLSITTDQNSFTYCDFDDFFVEKKSSIFFKKKANGVLFQIFFSEDRDDCLLDGDITYFSSSRFSNSKKESQINKKHCESYNIKLKVTTYGVCDNFDDEDECDTPLVTPKPTYSGNGNGNVDLTKINENIDIILYQLANQYAFNEDRNRAYGSSGILKVRGIGSSYKSYGEPLYSDDGYMTLHEHTDFENTAGLGEMVISLNGVHFMTRHNDYKMNMKSRTKEDYKSVEPIKFPDVPPSVLNKNTVNEQLEEMQQYFKAFKNQDSSIRNYKEYFKPFLCYLEGYWIKKNYKSDIEQPFMSDRHRIMAKTYGQLFEKIEFLNQGGFKDKDENYAALPSKIIFNYKENKFEQVQYQYRILCEPIDEDIPLNRLKVRSDLAEQMKKIPTTREELFYSRSASFDLHPDPSNDFDPNNWNGFSYLQTYLDLLMEKVPGLNNKPGKIETSFDSINIVKGESKKKLNEAYYSRFYSFGEKDAMGDMNNRRGFYDPNLFCARTTHNNIAGYSSVDHTNIYEEVDTNLRNNELKYSCAIPLEIIYTTPLHNYNPYNLKHYENPDKVPSKSGECDNKNDYITESFVSMFYRTPFELFDKPKKGDSADTAADFLCAKDQNGNKVKVAPSGIAAILPSIKNVGPVRLRYPIAPPSLSNSERIIDALKDIVYPNDNYDSYDNPIFGKDRDIKYGIKINLSGGTHNHFAFIESNQAKDLLLENKSIQIITELRNSHQHTINISFINNEFILNKCDGNNNKCFDNHQYVLKVGVLPIDDEEED